MFEQGRYRVVTMTVTVRTILGDKDNIILLFWTVIIHVFSKKTYNQKKKKRKKTTHDTVAMIHWRPL